MSSIVTICKNVCSFVLSSDAPTLQIVNQFSFNLLLISKNKLSLTSQYFMSDLSQDWNSDSVSPFLLLSSFHVYGSVVVSSSCIKLRSRWNSFEEYLREKKTFTRQFKSADLVKILNMRENISGISPPPSFYLFPFTL